MHNLCTEDKVIVPRIKTYFMINFIAHRASLVWNIFTSDLTKTSNVINYTRMVSRSDNLCNLNFWGESPQSTPNYDSNNLLCHLYEFNVFFLYVLVSLFARHHKRQRFNRYRVCTVFAIFGSNRGFFFFFFFHSRLELGTFFRRSYFVIIKV